MAVRNEVDSLGVVLASLDAQLSPPAVVVVVNDGSTDGTGQLLTGIHPNNFALYSVGLPEHRMSYVGRPELASVFNSGLAKLSAVAPYLDYVMILGGDHPLPSTYVGDVVSRLEGDPRIAVGGGRVAGEPFWEESPRGSGMVVRTRFWKKANGIQFPVSYGWESWLYLKAQSMGYQTRSFPDIVTHISRPTSMRKGALYGRGMYALGYFWLFAVGRCLSYSRYSPSVSFQMLRGFLDHRGVKRLDVSRWVSRMQRRTILKRVARVALRRGFGAPTD